MNQLLDFRNSKWRIRNGGCKLVEAETKKMHYNIDNIDFFSAYWDHSTKKTLYDISFKNAYFKRYVFMKAVVIQWFPS